MSDPLVRILADMLREVAERKAVERAGQRGKLRVVEQPRRRKAA